MHVRLYREAKRLLIKYEKANQGRWRTEERLASVGNKLRVLTVELTLSGASSESFGYRI